MKKTFKSRLLSIALAFALVCSIVPMMAFLKTKNRASAESVSNSSYYYQELSDTQKGLYNAIKTAHANGSLQSGSGVDLISSGAVSSSDVREYSQGNSELIQEFNIAKDAYMFDHPELFYVDFEKLTLSFGFQNNRYVAFIDSGKYSNYFYESLPQGSVSLAISNFNGADGISKFVQGSANTSTEKVVMISRNITNTVISTDDSVYSTAYTAFNGKANAEGYAKLLKACLDKINIPCVVVYGYLASESAEAVSRHCFNYVQIDGRWLAVDLYLNELTSSENYTLVRAEKLEARHIISNTVFGSKEFNVPELESFKFEKSYTKQNLLLEITYNGLNASQLLYHKDLYIVQILSDLGESMPAKALFDEVYTDSQIVVDGAHSLLIYAVTAVAPDEGVDYASLSRDDLIVVESFTNEVKLFDDTIRPFIDVVKVENQTAEEECVYEFGSVLKKNDSWHIEFAFDENLKKVGEEISINVSVNGKDISSAVEISNIVWSDSFAKIVSFDFVPSKAFAHQGKYCFEIEGLVSAVVNNDTTKPRPVYIDFANENVQLSNVSALNSILKKVQIPELSVMSDVEMMNLKWANGSSATELKNQDLVLMSHSVDSTVLDKQSIAGENAKFFNLSLMAKQKQLSLNSGLVSIVFPKPDEDLIAKVYHVDENGENATLLSSVMTDGGVVVSTSKLGNFKVVYQEANSTSKMLALLQTNSFGKLSIVSKDSLVCLVSGSVQISIDCASGYEVESVILNNKDITSKLASGKVQISASELEENNVVRVSFISSQKKLVDAQKGFSSLDNKFIANQQIDFVPVPPEDAQPAGLSKGVLLIIIVGAWVVLCGGIVATILLLKKKSAKNIEEIQSENKEEQE